MIAELLASDSPVGRDYIASKRRLDGVRHFASSSDLYPLCGRGRIKTDPLFAEMGRALLAGKGRSGMILPTGIATDATTQYFFKDLVENGSISSLYDFENRKPLFEAVDSRYKFCLLTLAGRNLAEPEADFAFFALDPADLDRPGVRFTLTPEEITLLNPNTGTCPIFRSRQDAEITIGIYRRVPVLIREGDRRGNPWGVTFMQGLFNMTSDSSLFRTRDELEADGWTLRGNVFTKGKHEMLPIYEAKMIHHYDHRWATYERDGKVRDVTLSEKRDANFVVMPRYWVDRREVDVKLEGRWDRKWLLGWRDICRSTDERTCIATIDGENASPEGGTLLTLCDPPEAAPLLLANWNSFAFDFVARQKVGGTHLKYFTMRQLPMLSVEMAEARLPWADRSVQPWITERVMGLLLDNEEMRKLGDDFGTELVGDAWDPSRRASIRAELDAAFFHLYGIGRDDVDYIMETFPIAKRKDLAAHGEYRTKRMILEVYDAMAAAERSGDPYRSPFDAEGSHG